MAANAACEALKAPIRLLLTTARATFEASSSSLEVARGAFRAAEETLNAAQAAVRLATESLEVVSDLYEAGIKVASAIIEIGFSGIVNIKKISFETSLSTAATGRFSASVRGCFVGVEGRLSVTLDLHNIREAASELANLLKIRL